jgi:transposase
MKQSRKIYDRAFKEKVVQFERHNISELARTRNTPLSCKWRKEYEEFGQGSFPGVLKLLNRNE